MLCYAAALALGGSLDDADAPATAVELLHCYSLVHDDLPAMDDDDLRRGRPTLHRAFDEATAILAGDMLQAAAFRTLAETERPAPPETRLRMMRILAQAAEDMVRGQALDFAAVGNPIDEAELTAVHRLKTGALIRASVLLGALAVSLKPAPAAPKPAINENPQAALSEDQAQPKPQTGERQDPLTALSEAPLKALTAYADNIGLAFQIQDDILDETADTATLGKPQGSDRQSHKPTYTTLLGLKAAQAKANSLAADAVAALQGWDQRANTLRQLASYIVSRSH